MTQRAGDADGSVSLAVALPVWLKIALLSFGGPAAQIAVMHRILVKERKWVAEDRFLHCASFCMILPGPEAQQLATYLGWLLHGTRGGLIAGCLFVLPGFVSILVLSILYVGFRDTNFIEGLFFGLKPAVMAVVLEALLRMGRRTLRGRARVLLAAGAFLAIFFFDVPFPLIVVTAGILGYGGSRIVGPGGRVSPAVPEAPSRALHRPSWPTAVGTAVTWLSLWFVPIGLLFLWFGEDNVLVQEAFFFSQAAVVTIGGAYAVLSYVAQQAVELYGWLAPGEMLDGLGMAETTPGPLIQVVQFVGYVGAWRHSGDLPPQVAGMLGALVTTWVTFVPCFLFVFVGAPFAEELRGRRSFEAALTSITAAIVGVILNLAVWFSLHTLFADVAEQRLGPLRILTPVPQSVDGMSLALAVGAGVAILRFRAGVLGTLAVSALIGLIYRLAVQP